MMTQMHESTITTTDRTIEGMLPSLGTHAREFLDGLRKLDPDLAARAARIRVLTDEEYRERGSDRFNADSSEWVWFDEAPSHTSFARILAGVLFGVGHPISQYLGDLLGQAVMEQDEDVLRLVPQIAVASREWSIRGVEERLGMSLGAAYRQAGVIPVWEAGRGSGEMSEGESIASMEPVEFLSNCTEGLLCDDSFWLEYTRRLFRAAE